MKQKSFLLLLLTVLLPLTAWAKNFTVDGIYYSTTTDWEVEVARPTGDYQGAVNIPASVTYEGFTYRVTGIGEMAIQGPGVTSITLPAGTIRTIKYRGFFDCRNVTTITVPASVTEIGQEAFAYCDNMGEIFFCSPTPPIVASNTFTNVNKTNCRIRVPSGSVDDYKAIPEFNAFSVLYDWNAPEIYGIEVVGCLVTEGNATNIFGDGSASYNESTRTLTISKNFSTTTTDQPVVYNKTVEGLTIAFDNCTLAAKGYTLQLQKETALTGTGTINSETSNPIYCESALTIMNATINYNGNEGIFGSNSEDLEIKNSNVKGTSYMYYSVITGFKGVNLTDCFYLSPAEAYYEGMELKDSWHGGVCYDVTIKAGDPTPYDLWIAGTQVNEQNCGNILGDGTTSYDPSTNTLVLYGSIMAYDTGVDGIKCNIDGLTIQVEDGISVNSADADAIHVNENCVIEGYGPLTLEAGVGCAIYAKKGLTIKNAKVGMGYCNWGFQGNGDVLLLNNATLSGETVSKAAAIAGFSEIQTTNCYFDKPVGGKYVNKQLVDLDGNPAAEVWVISGAEKTYVPLSFAREDYTTAMGKSFEAPELYNPNGVNVTYASSNPAVAEVNAATGEVNIKTKGSTTISASYSGTSTTYANRASYFLTVLKSAAMLYDVNGDGKVSITDAVAVVNAILNGETAAPEATPAPEAAPALTESESAVSPE